MGVEERREKQKERSNFKFAIREFFWTAGQCGNYGVREKGRGQGEKRKKDQKSIPVGTLKRRCVRRSREGVPKGGGKRNGRRSASLPGKSLQERAYKATT